MLVLTRKPEVSQLCPTVSEDVGEGAVRGERFFIEPSSVTKVRSAGFTPDPNPSRLRCTLELSTALKFPRGT